MINLATYFICLFAIGLCIGDMGIAANNDDVSSFLWNSALGMWMSFCGAWHISKFFKLEWTRDDT